MIRNGALSYTNTYASYDKSSNPKCIHLPEQAGTLRIKYDLLNRPLTIRTKKWKDTFKYDSHLLVERSLRDGFGKSFSSYEYDALDQLLSECGAADHSFEYDWQGNPIAFDGNERKFNDCNALVQDQTQSYHFDDNGNRISDGINNYAYDALGRLVEAKTSMGIYRYVYDALGRRIARIHEQETTYFIWQKQHEIGTIDSKGKIQELQILNPTRQACAFNQAIAFELQGILYVPLQDTFGHVRALLDASGNCAATYRYSAFGKEQIQGEILAPWRYAGKRFDLETGLIYFGARYYDPSTMCWMTPDPLEDADGPNLYRYVHNNPLYYTDPDGRAAFAIVIPLFTITWGGYRDCFCLGYS